MKRIRSGRLWRRLRQFSLRGMLVLTLAAAVAVRWGWQVQPTEHELSNGLIVRQQQREETREVNNQELTLIVRIGRYEVRDAKRRLLVEGRYADNRAAGRWTYYHRNGRPSLRGLCDRGACVGTWLAWDEAGRRRREVVYGAPQPGVAKAGQAAADDDMFVPLRSLRVSARAWHANGRLHWEGSFERDRKAGLWSEWDSEGKLVSQGRYLNGRRHGSWQESHGGQRRDVNYCCGRVIGGGQTVAQWLAAELESDDSNRRCDAVDDCGELGELDLLRRALGDASSAVVVRALRAITAVGVAAEELLPDIEALALEPPDDSTELAIQVAIFAVSPSHQPDRIEQLSDWASRSEPRRQDAIDALARHAGPRLDGLEAQLKSADPAVARFVADVLITAYWAAHEIDARRRVQTALDRAIEAPEVSESFRQYLKEKKAAPPRILCRSFIPVVG